MASPALSLLLDRHTRIEQAFLGHQEALLDRDIPRARRELDLHRHLLDAHIREEDDVVLPAYAELGPAPRGGDVDIFFSEHRKILHWLGVLEELMGELELRDPLRPQDLLLVLDRESTFKHLMEHHDLRERQFLYPTLDSALGSDRREELWSQLDPPEGYGS